MPNPLLTRDQLKLLKYDNILTGKYKSNSEIGVPSVRYFEEEVQNIVTCGGGRTIFYRKILIQK